MEFQQKINFFAALNENSPLYLRIAQEFLSKNDPQNAILVLKRGLKKFPEHPVAHILLGVAFLQNRNYELAENNFKLASELINSKRTYEFYTNELKNISRFTLNRENFLNDTKLKITRIESGKEERKNQSTETNAIEDRLEQLSEALSSARIPRSSSDGPRTPDNQYFIPDRSKITSETLAKIYLTQGERKEAIKVYEKLIKKDPAKESYYLEKIREIRSA